MIDVTFLEFYVTYFTLFESIFETLYSDIMKCKFLKKIFFVLAFSTTILSCENPPKKELERADAVNESLVAANVNLKADSILMHEKFRRQSDERLAENDKQIAELKGKLKTEKKELREKYENELAELKEKNTALKTKMNDYKDDKGKWDAFKKELNDGIDNVGKSISKLTKKTRK